MQNKKNKKEKKNEIIERKNDFLRRKHILIIRMSLKYKKKITKNKILRIEVKKF